MKHAKREQRTLPPDSIDTLPTDDPLEFSAALIRALQGTPSAADGAPRGDTVTVRRVNGRGWTRCRWSCGITQQRDRHLAMPGDAAWDEKQHARYRAIVDERISLCEELRRFRTD